MKNRSRWELVGLLIVAGLIGWSLYPAGPAAGPADPASPTAVQTGVPRGPSALDTPGVERGHGEVERIVVARISGRVDMRFRGERWTEVEVSSPLAPGDEVRTAEKSEARLAVSSGVGLTLLGEAWLRFTRTPDVGAIAFELKEGLVRVNTGSTSGIVAINTPEAALQSKGPAEWSLTRTSDGEVQLIVLRGRLTVRSSILGTELVVTAGHTLICSPDGQLTLDPPPSEELDRGGNSEGSIEFR